MLPVSLLSAVLTGNTVVTRQLLQGCCSGLCGAYQMQRCVQTDVCLTHQRPSGFIDSIERDYERQTDAEIRLP